MTPDVVVDIGNSRIKFARCLADRVALVASLPSGDPTAWDDQLSSWEVPRPLRWAVASVHPERLDRFHDWITARGDEIVAVNNYKQLPLRIGVREPAKVGIDRLLNAVALLPRLPKGTPGIVVDVGTAITVDLVNDHHVFVGGAILPGPRLMFESLHQQTAKLPRIDLHEVPVEDPPGANTRDAMIVGVMAAVMGGAELLVDRYASLSPRPPWVVLTGGALGGLADYHFEDVGKTLTDRTLTLEGIRLVAETLS
ncbi:MAG: coaX [Gemmataceae bacterium]|nr:coaX [Gemmataceae bacterium]